MSESCEPVSPLRAQRAAPPAEDEPGAHGEAQATVVKKAPNVAIMSDYEDAESLDGEAAAVGGLRKRFPWDGLSISSDVPGLHEVKVRTVRAQRIEPCTLSCA